MASYRNSVVPSYSEPLRHLVSIILLPVVLVLFNGCSSRPAKELDPTAAARVETVYDYLLHIDDAHLSHELPAGSAAATDSRNPRIRSIDGQMHYSILSHPPSEMTWRCRINPGARLVFSLALDPTAREQGSDGVLFEVHVREHFFSRTVFSHYLDPRDGSETSGWKSFEVDLDRCAGKTVEIIFSTGPGPRGSHDHDLAYWGEPRLLSRGRLVEKVTPLRPPVFLVSLDTVRLDHLDLAGHHRRTAPHLNRLLGETVLFTEARAPSHWTMPSHMSVFTSLTPDIHRVDDPQGGCRLADNAPMLSELLRDAGYRSAGFVTSDFLQGRIGFDRGFDHYELRQFNPGERQNLLARDWIETNREDALFVFLHYIDAHSDWVETPYEAAGGFDALFGGPDPEEPFSGCSADRVHCASKYLTYLNQTASRLSPAQCRELRRQYDRGIRYLDYQLARFVAGLKQLGLWESSLVVFFSDHGEEFEDHGMYLHGQLYEELLRVPLLIKLPGGRHGGTRVDVAVELVDLAPTILALLDIPVPRTMQGRELASLIERPGDSRSIFSWSADAGSFQEGRWKLFFQVVDGRPRPHRLFDLGRDPGELVDRLGGEPGVLERLELALGQRLDQNRRLAENLAPASAENPDTVFSEEERARLEMLGYLQ